MSRAEHTRHVSFLILRARLTRWLHASRRLKIEFVSNGCQLLGNTFIQLLLLTLRLIREWLWRFPRKTLFKIWKSTATIYTKTYKFWQDQRPNSDQHNTLTKQTTKSLFTVKLLMFACKFHNFQRRQKCIIYRIHLLQMHDKLQLLCCLRGLKLQLWGCKNKHNTNSWNLREAKIWVDRIYWSKSVNKLPN